MRTREEHLKWCKVEAHKYLGKGDVSNAVTSMLSDLDKHKETKVNFYIIQFGMMLITNHDMAGAKRFIDGFR